jgi:hypothetical protein
MAKKWKVDWQVNAEYRIIFHAQSPHEDVAWVYAPNHHSFPKARVFECIEAQGPHFDAKDTFEIDGNTFSGLAELVAYLRTKR